MPKDRLEQSIEAVKEEMKRLENHPLIARYIALQEMLPIAEKVNNFVLSMEEDIPVINSSKERKPRARKQAKMPEMNGTYTRTVTAEETNGERLVVEPTSGTSRD